MPGPPRKPTYLRLEKKDPSHRPLPVNEPKPALGLPDPPSHLDELAAKLWTEEFGPTLLSMKVMTKADWAALATLCTEYACMITLNDDIQENGMFVAYTTTQGDVMQKTRPQVDLVGRVSARVVVLLREFGLTPSSRTKVQMVTQQPQDESEDGEGKSERYFG